MHYVRARALPIVASLSADLLSQAFVPERLGKPVSLSLAPCVKLNSHICCRGVAIRGPPGDSPTLHVSFRVDFTGRGGGCRVRVSRAFLSGRGSEPPDRPFPPRAVPRLAIPRAVYRPEYRCGAWLEFGFGVPDASYEVTVRRCWCTRLRLLRWGFLLTCIFGGLSLASGNPFPDLRPVLISFSPGGVGDPALLNTSSLL